MMPVTQRLLVLTALLSLLLALQVQAAPIDTDWAAGLIHRAKRSLLWRWNTLKPVGSGCRDHYECGTNFCRKHTCSFNKAQQV
ncbi:liver-expressed antimicrobial peptide 2-like [Sinocyclocheilus anshuiensis]|uniref:liver-expressed antimicrobial peptide 2-like n=1 Tax=Sinocyclocheilus anshuiensis TaxID=1608454 RepID=UPI0007B96822|nr:PREDICTED: liver-expressed antimicrobial peptide 2-like [Sinocyclocheilus anshuiensis]